MGIWLILTYSPQQSQEVWILQVKKQVGQSAQGHLASRRQGLWYIKQCTYLISWNPQKTNKRRALFPFQRWINWHREANLSLVPHGKLQKLKHTYNQTYALPPSYMADACCFVSNSEEVLKSVLTSGYISLPQAKIFLHLLALERSFWCASAPVLSDTTCFLCRLPDSHERAIHSR